MGILAAPRFIPQRESARVWRTPLAVNPGPHRTVLGYDGRALRVRSSRLAPPWSEPFKEATMTQLLLTDEQRSQLLANGRITAEGGDHDPQPVVKLFTPDAHATWLLAELDPADGDTAFGLCDIGIGMPELGNVRISELASIVGPLKLPIERDLHFVAKRTLSEYARLAQINGSIID